MDKEVIELYLDDIIPNRFQPREVFNEEALEELAQSIKEHGVFQPIIVRKIGEKYEIIAGERRYKASVLAGKTTIPAIVRNLNDKEASKIALIENLQRKDLTPIEEARTYEKILELDQMTQEELGKTMGKSQATIANKMRLLTLPDEIQDALLHEKISERHARSLLNLDTEKEQIDMLNKIINDRLTVRELDSEIKKMRGEEVEEDKEETPVIEAPAEKEIEEPAENDGLEYDFSLPEEYDFSLPEDEDIIKKNQETEDKLDKIDFLLKQTKPEKTYVLRDAVSDIKNTVAKLQGKGFSVKVDEMDFEYTYQVVIKIDKNK